jgi:hypothetical protein
MDIEISTILLLLFFKIRNQKDCWRPSREEGIKKMLAVRGNKQKEGYEG